MLRRNQNIEELNKKCELLEDLGFTINHRDRQLADQFIKMADAARKSLDNEISLTLFD